MFVVVFNWREENICMQPKKMLIIISVFRVTHCYSKSHCTKFINVHKHLINLSCNIHYIIFLG